MGSRRRSRRNFLHFPSCRTQRLFVEAYERLKRKIWVLDITNDLGIPSFAAVSRYTGGKPEDILVAFGAHLDARIAIELALCEMNHLLPAVLPDNRNPAGDYAYPEPSQKHWWRNATIETETYLVPAPEMASRQCRDYPALSPSSEVEQVTAVFNGFPEWVGGPVLIAFVGPECWLVAIITTGRAPYDRWIFARVEIATHPPATPAAPGAPPDMASYSFFEIHDSPSDRCR